MKTIIIFLFTSLVYVSSNAQDPQLFENTWYLSNVIIDGENNYPPNNNEAPVDVEFEIDISSLSTQFCTFIIGGNIDYSLVEDKFTVSDWTVGAVTCSLNENQIYESLYIYGFFTPQLQNKIFLYEIDLTAGGQKVLTLTNEDGDMAIYGDEPLTVENFSSSYFSLYPNPVKESLKISSAKALGNFSIQIFSTEGKLLRNQNFNSKSNLSIGISKLSSGIYFLKIADESGRVEVKKFVKQ